LSEPAPPRAEVERALGYVFVDPSLLDLALRHSSYAHENENTASNERLEFLGDAVIGMVVGHQLYEAHPDWAEGDLTRALHALVDRRSLAELAGELGLGTWLQLGRTEQQAGGTTKSSILADGMEAVLGAIYLDGGLEPVHALVRGWFAAALAPDAPQPVRDPKTHLQEAVMAQAGEFPSYGLLHDSEVEGDAERFTVEVRVAGDGWGTGTGRSKRLAERQAAERAIARLEMRDASGETE